MKNNTVESISQLNYSWSFASTIRITQKLTPQTEFQVKPLTLTIFSGYKSAF